MPETVKIVNVDDHAPARYAKNRTLKLAGFTVFDAANGQEAMNLVSTHDPDLVLLDVNLPDLDGIEVCRRVKTSPQTASVIVLQISASAISAPQATAALNNGADAYLIEPVDPDVLVATVRALLRLRKAERELFTANESLKTLNRELQRSNEDLQQFAFVASHDLQEPLRTVTSFVGLLERAGAEKFTEDEKQYLHFIAEGSQRMRSLINDLLQYSQLGQTPADAGTVDLTEVFHWAAENLREQIGEAKAQVESEALPEISGDAAQLLHVFQNLIGNAIKYRRPGVPAIIRVTANCEGEECVIAVRDNGIGIEPQYHEQIFVPFKRLHGREVSGTGIGLAVCRRIVEAHGGRISVESTPGEGSTFSFALPLPKS